MKNFLHLQLIIFWLPSLILVSGRAPQDEIFQKPPHSISSDCKKDFTQLLKSGREKREKEKNAVKQVVSLVRGVQKKTMYNELSADKKHGKGDQRYFQRLKRIDNNSVHPQNGLSDAKLSKRSSAISKTKHLTPATKRKFTKSHQKRSSEEVLRGSIARRSAQLVNPTQSTRRTLTTSQKEEKTSLIQLTTATPSFLSSHGDSLPKHLEKSGHVYFIPQTSKERSPEARKVSSPERDNDTQSTKQRQDLPQASEPQVVPLESHSIPHGPQQLVRAQLEYKSGLRPRSVPRSSEVAPLSASGQLNKVWQQPGAYRHEPSIASLERQHTTFRTPALTYQSQAEEFQPPYGNLGLTHIPNPPRSSPVNGPPRPPRSPATAAPAPPPPAASVPLEALLGAVVGTLTILLILLAVLLVFLIRRQQRNHTSQPSSPAPEEELHQQPVFTRPLPKAPSIPLQQAPRRRPPPPPERRPPPPPPPPLPERPLYCNNAFQPTRGKARTGPPAQRKTEDGEAMEYYQLVTPVDDANRKHGINRPGESVDSGLASSIARTRGSSLASVARSSLARTGDSVASIGRAGGSVAGSTGQTTIDWSCKSYDLSMENYSCFSMCTSDNNSPRDTDIKDLVEKERIQEKEMEERKETDTKREIFQKTELNKMNDVPKKLNFHASNTVADPQKARINSKESSIQSLAAKPPEEQSSNWDSKTYGVPMWKRGELDLELD